MSRSTHTPKERAMLLSRVAESMYWTGRYLERAEATARIVKVHTDLYLDMPLSAGLGWAPLLAVTGTDGAFAERYDLPTEDHVVAFLTADLRNPSSIASSLARARANVRATQAVFPREAWETINHLHLDASEQADEAVGRMVRRPWTEQVIAGCQRFAGILAGTMSHDAAYNFLRIGMQIERADMTTRVLDVRAGTLLRGASAHLVPYRELLWTGVLKSLGAHQMFLRTGELGVDRRDIVRFLLQDPWFPRSVEHCLVELSRCLLELPRHEAAMQVCATVVQALAAYDLERVAGDGLHDYVDALQLRLGDLHGAIGDTYFLAAANDEGATADNRNQTVASQGQRPRTAGMLATA